MISYNTEVKVDISKNNYVEAGIVENVELKSIRYEKTEKGNEFIEFVFEDENGSRLVQTEYKPKGKDESEELERTIKQIKRIKQIICGYDEKNPASVTIINPSEYVIHANDFKSFCEQTIRIVGTKNVGKKLRIKAVYNDNGYVTLPKYSTYAFVEPMTILKEKSMIKILSIDKMTRPVPQASTGTSNPFEVTPKAVSNDDLPF